MSIAVIPSTGPSGASARHRALQHVERLRRAHAVDVLLPREGGDDPARSGPTGKVLHFGEHGARYLQRRASLARAVPGYDAVLVQRGVYRMGPGAAVQPIERFEGRVVFDLDDAVFIPSATLAGRGRTARWLYGPQQALRLMNRADAIVVSSVELAACLPDGHTADAVLPTVPDPARYRVKPHAEHLLPVVGWVGNAGNLPHLEVLAPAAAALQQERAAEVLVVSSRPWDVPSRFHPWSLEHEADDLLRFDIGVMPLLDTPYARAKAGFKLLQYLAAGLPVVASPVGINREIVEGSGAGALAETPADWSRELRRLGSDAGLRAELGARGRAWIESYADLEGQATTLARLLGGPPSGS